MQRRADSATTTSAVRPRNAVPGAGQPLDAGLQRQFGATFGQDLSHVRVHTDHTAADQARAFGARAYATGSDIVFSDAAYAPTTVAGQRLIAHEIAHVVQQGGGAGVPQGFGLSEAEYEKEADIAADAAIAGKAVSRLTPVPGVRTQRQESGDLPPQATMTIALDYFRFQTVKPVNYRPGAANPQLFGIVVRRLMGGIYTPGIEKTLEAEFHPTFTPPTPDIESGVARRIPYIYCDHFFIANLRDLAARKGYKITLSKEQEELHRLGMAARRAWADVTGLPAWFTREIFIAVMGQRGALLRAYAGAMAAANIDPRDTTAQSTPEMLQRAADISAALGPATNVVEAVRTDGALVSHRVYQKLWPSPPPAAAQVSTGSAPPTGDAVQNQPAGSTVAVMAPPDQVPDFESIVGLLGYIETQPAIKDEVLNTKDPELAAKARKDLLDRYEHFLGRRRDDAQRGDQQISDFPSAYNVDPYPATLSSHPPITFPLFDATTSGEYAFIMNVQFPTVLSAFHSHTYLFERIKVKKEDVAGLSKKLPEVKGETPGSWQVLKSRLSKATDYTAEDLRTFYGDRAAQWGAPGVSVEPFAINALLRYAGSAIRTGFEMMGDRAWVRRMQFPEEGMYIVRAKAVFVSRRRDEVVRPPTVAYQPVFASPPDVFAQSRMEQALDQKELTKKRIDELLKKRSEPGAKISDIDAEVEGLQKSLGSAFDMLFYQLTTLDRRRSPKPPAPAPSASEKRRIDEQIQHIEEILDNREGRQLASPAERLQRLLRKKQLAQNADPPATAEEIAKIDAEIQAVNSLAIPTLTLTRERVMTTFVSDSGAVYQLLLEVADTEPAGGSPKKYFVADSTTHKGKSAYGTGATSEEAIIAAVTNVLQKGGYGRGNASIYLNGKVIPIRIVAGEEAIVKETLSNVALVLSVAAIAAAPVTGGASISLLIPAGVIGAIPSAYNIIDRNIDGTFRWDLETAGDIVNIAGAVIGLGAEAQLAQKSIWVGGALLVGGVGTLGGAVVVMGAQLMEQVKGLEDLPPELRAAALMEILGHAMLNAGIMVGGMLAAGSKLKATRRALEIKGQDFATWFEGLNEESKTELQKQQRRAIFEAYRDMDPIVRELSTLCASFCFMDPPPTKAQQKQLLQIHERLAPTEQRLLQQLLHENAGAGLEKLIRQLTKLSDADLAERVRSSTDPVSAALVLFSEEFKGGPDPAKWTPQQRALREATKRIVDLGTVPLDQLGGILDNVRKTTGGDPIKMLQYVEELAKRNLPGTDKVLADLAGARNFHKGAKWVLEFIDRSGLWDRVRQWEFQFADETTRRWDCRLKDGTLLEFKSWNAFYELKFLQQILSDAKLSGNFTTLSIKWIFEVGIGDAATIVKMMHEALDRALTTGNPPGFTRTNVAAIKAALNGVVEVGVRPVTP